MHVLAVYNLDHALRHTADALVPSLAGSYCGHSLWEVSIIFIFYHVAILHNKSKENSGLELKRTLEHTGMPVSYCRVKQRTVVQP